MCVLAVVSSVRVADSRATQEVFLRPPKCSNMWTDYETMKMTWNKMQWFVAFENLGLDEAQFAAPSTYMHNPGGQLGVDTLFNLFQVPF